MKPANTATRRQQSTLCLQLYAASIILGAGVFTLPFLVPQVGLIPAVVMIIVMAAVASPLYQRLVPSDLGGGLGGDGA